MKASLLLAPAAVMAALAGCTVGPDYHAPVTQAPAQWSEPLHGGATAQTPAVAAWWKNFHDPELDSLVERAIAANLDLKIAEARVREARARTGIAAAAFGPSLDATGSYERQKQSQNQPVLGSFAVPSDAFENNLYQAGFDAAWEIDVFGGNRRALEGARAELAAAEYGRQDMQVTLAAEVARHYVTARSFQRHLAIAQRNLAAQADALALTQERAEKGLGSSLEVQQAATVLAQTRAQVPAFETGLQAAIHRLGVLLAQPPGALQAELAAVAPLPATPPEVPVGLPSELLLRRPDIRQAERNLAAATAHIGVATAELFPKFSLTGTAGLESISAGSFFSGASGFWSIGPTMRWKLFDSGRIRANIKVQNAREEQALAHYEQTVLLSFEEVENALVAYAKEQVRRASLAEAVRTSQDAFDLSTQLYANGLTSFLNVLDSERSWYRTQDELVQSEQAVVQNLIALYKALGGGWEPEAKLAEAHDDTVAAASPGRL